MPIQIIEPRRLYRQIADQLRELIEAGEFPEGARLPPERDLALKLGVSRPSVREALIALEVEGWVEVRMGSGVYVRGPGAAPQASLTAESPLETIRARQVVEGELAALAAQNAVPAAVEGLRAAVDAMAREAAAGNAVLARVVGELFDERHNPLSVKLGDYFENPASWAAAIDEHRQVIDAIAARDPQAARAAMHHHLSRSHDRLTASWPAPLEAPAAHSERAEP